MLSLVLSDNVLTVFLDGIPSVVTNPSVINAIIECYKEHKDENMVREILQGNGLKEYCKGADNLCGIEIKDDSIYIDGEKITTSLGEQIRRQYESGLPVEPFVNFVRKVRENPSYNVRYQLWDFISASQKSGGFTISDDGDILAYKKVRSDYTDYYSGTFDNHIGCTVEMPRNEVDDNPNSLCSSGLHFCAYSYLDSYFSDDATGHVMLVQVNPKDVVSVPTDYDNAKARCCKYKVIDEVHGVLEEPVYTVDTDEFSINLDTWSVGRSSFFNFRNRNFNRKCDKQTWARLNDDGSITIHKSKNITSEYEDELREFCFALAIDYDSIGKEGTFRGNRIDEVLDSWGVIHSAMQRILNLLDKFTRKQIIDFVRQEFGESWSKKTSKETIMSRIIELMDNEDHVRILKDVKVYWSIVNNPMCSRVCLKNPIRRKKKNANR